MTEDFEFSLEQVESILYELEQKGMVFRTWDIKKNDYIWHQTESGRKIAEKLELEYGL